MQAKFLPLFRFYPNIAALSSIKREFTIKNSFSFKSIYN